jgi:ABC-2 type transport system ATP-binding protein
MRRRLDLAAGLVADPAVLVLDEPTTGLDPRSRLVLWDAVAELVAGGATVLLTTQYLDEADRLAGEVVIVDHGRIVARGAPATLKREVGALRLELELTGAEAMAVARERLGRRVVAEDAAALTVGVGTDGTAAAVRALLDDVDPDRTLVARFAVRTATLDDVFLALTSTPKEPARV